MNWKPIEECPKDLKKAVVSGYDYGDENWSRHYVVAEKGKDGIWRDDYGDALMYLTHYMEIEFLD